MNVDVSQLVTLERDLRQSGRTILVKAARITRSSISQINTDAQRQIRNANYAHLPHLARSFTWDVETDWVLGQVVGEAGAEHSMLQGRLDVYIEFGTPTSPEHPHWRPASAREVPRWIDRLERATAEDFE